MHIYTHIVLAHALESHLKPDDPPAYYLGAVIPDVRYLAGTRRAATHPTAIQLLDYFQRYPHLESFLLGYLVHCEIDLLDVSRALFDRTPLRFFSTLRRLQLGGVLIESHFLENTRVQPPLSNGSNDMLAALGIEPEHVRRYAEGVRRFLQEPSFEAELAALQEAQILESAHLRALLRALQFFESSRGLRRLLFRRVPAAETAEKLPAILLASPVIQGFVHR